MTIIQTQSFKLAIYSSGNPDAEKLALVLPGRLDAKDYASCKSHVEYLANKGFLVVSFDPPGTWESPGSIDLFTTTNYIKAVNELIEYFGNKPTLLIGHSRGGTISILVGTTNPAVKMFAVVMATYGNPSSPSQEAMKTGFEIEYRDLPPGSSKITEQKRYNLPISYFEDGKQYNLVALLKSSTKPKVLFYGTHDAFTTTERVKEVYASIPEPKMIHELNTEHDYRYHQEVIEEVNNVISNYLQNNGVF